MEKKERLEIAEKASEVIDARVWTPNEKSQVIRLYLNNRNGYVIIDNDGDADIDGVKAGSFMEVDADLKNINITTYRKFK